MLVRSSGVQNKTQAQVLLVDTKELRLTFGFEQKRERTTFDERANKVRVHLVVVTQERIAVNVV